MRHEERVARIRALNGWVGEVRDGLGLCRWHNAAEETIVDGLAKAIAEHFPLPPAGEGDAE